MRNRKTILVLSALAGLTLGCDEPALDAVCPDLAEGDLVITEIRGEQDDDANEAGQWFEIFNPTQRILQLEGTKLTIKTADGTAPSSTFRGEILVRSPVTIEPGQYLVVGSGPIGRPPPTTDYAAGPDFEGNIVSNGLVELTTCGEVVDRVVIAGLPPQGSLTLDGAIDPTASANDDTEAWCFDERANTNPALNVKMPGSPQEANPTCLELSN